MLCKYRGQHLIRVERIVKEDCQSFQRSSLVLFSERKLKQSGVKKVGMFQVGEVSL